MTSYSARDIAAQVRKRLPDVPVKKLHKLLYYCQAHHLAAVGESLFTESISAWDMGPVVGQLWYEEKQGGGAYASDMILDSDESALNTIGYVISRYGRLSGNDLERLTHSEPPWRDADALRQQNGTRSERISVPDIREFFRTEADRESDDGVPVDDVELGHWLASVDARTPAAGETFEQSTRDSLLRFAQ